MTSRHADASARGTASRCIASASVSPRERPPPNQRLGSDIVRGIAEISDPRDQKERAVRLLLQAVRTLPDADQDLVLALLLQGLTDNEAWEAAVHRGDERRRVSVAALGAMDLTPGGGSPYRSELPAGTDAQVVPIRFRRDHYEELKDWCGRHDFPMAAVVRGLVEGFLDSQRIP